MPTMVGANEMLDFSYDDPIQDKDLPSQEKLGESLYAQEPSEQVDTLLDEPQGPTTCIYIR